MTLFHSENSSLISSRALRFPSHMSNYSVPNDGSRGVRVMSHERSSQLKPPHHRALSYSLDLRADAKCVQSPQQKRGFCSSSCLLYQGQLAKCISAQLGLDCQVYCQMPRSRQDQVPYLLICGKKEEEADTISIRKLGSEKQESIKRKDLIKNMLSLNKLPL